MKLVAAKCPNCGSNLEVNPNKETMKCEYCRSAILIDDAIEKYKIEISGEIEVKNLPKIDNYLKLAERNYKNKDYEEAYKIYGKVLELDSNNPISLLRYGICKTLLNNYIDFSMEYLINSFNETISLIKNNKHYDKNVEEFVKEVSFATDESLYAVRNYYNSYTINSYDLINIQTKLLSILLCYETILEYTINKKHIIEQIISVLKDLIKDKSYKTGSSIYGGVFLETYKINYGDKHKLTKKLAYYENILNPSSNNDTEFLPKESNVIDSSNPPPKKKIKSSIIVIDIFLWILIISSVNSAQLISSSILFFIFLIITYENISTKIFKSDKKRKKYCIIILLIILFFTINIGI